MREHYKVCKKDYTKNTADTTQHSKIQHRELKKDHKECLKDDKRNTKRTRQRMTKRRHNLNGLTAIQLHLWELQNMTNRNAKRTTNGRAK